MKNVLVIAPHADDESLGCGGVICSHIDRGDTVHWLLVTEMSRDFGYSEDRVIKRKQELEEVVSRFGFASVRSLGLEPARLDVYPMSEIVSKMSSLISSLKPEVVYTPFRNDAHSDHEVVYDAVMAATKVFRHPYIRRVLAYETISETDFGMKPEDGGFRPNVYIDISKYIEKKVNILSLFESEVGIHPFPRSEDSIRALATLRGAQSGVQAAEAFMLIKEICL